MEMHDHFGVSNSGCSFAKLFMKIPDNCCRREISRSLTKCTSGRFQWGNFYANWKMMNSKQSWYAVPFVLTYERKYSLFVFKMMKISAVFETWSRRQSMTSRWLKKPWSKFREIVDIFYEVHLSSYRKLITKHRLRIWTSLACFNSLHIFCQYLRISIYNFLFKKEKKIECWIRVNTLLAVICFNWYVALT